MIFRSEEDFEKKRRNIIVKYVGSVLLYLLIPLIFLTLSDLPKSTISPYVYIYIYIC